MAGALQGMQLKGDVCQNKDGNVYRTIDLFCTQLIIMGNHGMITDLTTYK